MMMVVNLLFLVIPQTPITSSTLHGSLKATHLNRGNLSDFGNHPDVQHEA